MPKGIVPDHTKFLPGQSGNPKGRPPGPSRSTIALKWLSLKETVLNPITGEKVKLTQEDIMTLAVIKKAKEGDIKAYTTLMDSAHGKAKQSTELEVIKNNPEPITGMVISWE